MGDGWALRPAHEMAARDQEEDSSFACLMKAKRAASAGRLGRALLGGDEARGWLVTARRGGAAFKGTTSVSTLSSARSC